MFNQNPNLLFHHPNNYLWRESLESLYAKFLNLKHVVGLTTLVARVKLKLFMHVI